MYYVFRITIAHSEIFQKHLKLVDCLNFNSGYDADDYYYMCFFMELHGVVNIKYMVDIN